MHLIIECYTEKSIGWNMIVVIVFILILNQMEFHLVQNKQMEFCLVQNKLIEFLGFKIERKYT